LAPTPHHTEQELLRQLSEGDRTAFNRIYTEHYPLLFRYLLVITRSNHESEEILQDVFLKLWIKRQALVGVLSLKDYLFRMAKNRVFDERRKAASREQYLRAIREESPANEVFDAVLLKEYHQVVQAGIAQMPARRQQIFRMNAQQELSAREIADALQLSLPVVKKQLYEAQHFLRKYLEQHGDMLFVVMAATAVYEAKIIFL